MTNLLTQPWPWYVAGPLIGLVVPLLLLLDNKCFGVSENLRHLCAIALPRRSELFRHDWRAESWNLALAGGMLIGGFIAGRWLANPDPIALAPATIADLRALGIHDFTGFMPREFFGWKQLATPAGATLVILGSFLVGFGSRYAGGCTSGHAISGLSDLQAPSLVAVLGFFAGGLFVTHFVLPVLFAL
jgi:uncharacterized membrane protein YedE/YeeE